MACEIRRITEKDQEWPLLLKEIPEKDRPKQLYIQGNLPPADALTVAIVGTRRTTAYGREAAKSIAETLALHNIVVISGMAVGIDTEAHKATIEANGKTIAVLGSGLNENVIYPKQNRNLARIISEKNGCLITEYEPDQKPEIWTFPQRNRIIAGIAKAVIVIEAREKSGALITAKIATEYNRELFALPGPIFQETSKGPHQLIRQGAIPISNPEDVLESLGIEKNNEIKNKEVSIKESGILKLLYEPLDIDSIIRKNKLSSSETQSLVSLMEIRGIIKKIGNTYVKNI
ncbi:DNA-processing protein DprA [Patescibacteria group bacterium]